MGRPQAVGRLWVIGVELPPLQRAEGQVPGGCGPSEPQRRLWDPSPVPLA